MLEHGAKGPDRVPRDQARAAFSPLLLLSRNDELLEILSQSKDPLAVQPHLSKCFENVHKLDVPEGPRR